MKLLPTLFSTIFFITFLSSSLLAQEDDKTDSKDSVIKNYEFPQVDIIGKSPGLINRIPNSSFALHPVQERYLRLLWHL